ncbi:28666687-85f4-46a5-9d55-13b89f28bce6 [Sclerotinia trifoliorum]|uniref:28666687-85f4-46a5-9d55-13b89f28bce6 n=1 Tax=Sclerotinia trifoliorum TaxID=28548 RepID=A0A8H2ZNP7_9HELO|nr:28666687-85f4-46a5-9d55-13b89f28bce6 [Sclerotinia trifoliorum]
MSGSRLSKHLVAIFILAFTLLIISIFAIVFISMDIIHIPYISRGLASFFSWINVILAPIYPFWAPLTLAFSIKLCRHETFPKQGQWITSSILMFSQHLAQVFVNTMKVFGFFDGVCNFRNCWHEYIQTGSVAVVIIGEVLGLSWDANILQNWVEKLVLVCEKEEEKEAAKNTEDGMEKGVVDHSTNEIEYLEDIKSGLDEEQVVIEAVDIDESKPVKVSEGETVKQGDQ